jgi:hypothetical protein
MDNHLHVIWQAIHPNTREKAQERFLRFTAHEITKDMKQKNTELLKQHHVAAADREYQIWERKTLSIPLWTEEVVRQKLKYIHENPVRARLCDHPEDYRFSSAALYNGLRSEWDFVTLCYL